MKRGTSNEWFDASLDRLRLRGCRRNRRLYGWRVCGMLLALARIQSMRPSGSLHYRSLRMRGRHPGKPMADAFSHTSSTELKGNPCLRSSWTARSSLTVHETDPCAADTCCAFPRRDPIRSAAQSSGIRRNHWSRAATATGAASTSDCWSGGRAGRAGEERLCRCDACCPIDDNQTAFSGRRSTCHLTHRHCVAFAFLHVASTAPAETSPLVKIKQDGVGFWSGTAIRVDSQKDRRTGRRQ